jgi:hypothetical protein
VLIVRKNKWPISLTTALTAYALTALVGCSGTAPSSGSLPSVGGSGSDARDFLSQLQQPHPLDTVDVDVRPYMAAAIGGTVQSPGKMLCITSTTICRTSVRDGGPTGEIKINYETNGIVDYIAISSYNHGTTYGAANYIGVVRNFTGGTTGFLRCFSTYGSMCSAPPNSYYMPEGVPWNINALPVVTTQAIDAATDSNGSPSGQIAGTLLITSDGQDGNYYPFGQMNMTHSCVQSPGYSGPLLTKVRVAYVRAFDFGGNVGKNDAIVIDTFAQGPPNHAERYFYVSGLGRVREETSTQNSQGVWGAPEQNIVWNNLKTANTKYVSLDQTAECPQGSYLPLWGSTTLSRVKPTSTSAR